MTEVLMTKEIRSSSDWLLWQTVERQPGSLGRLGDRVWRQENTQAVSGQTKDLHLIGFPGEHIGAVTKSCLPHKRAGRIFLILFSSERNNYS